MGIAIGLRAVFGNRKTGARLALTMTIDPAPVKVGETIPVQLTLRNDGPNDATQVAVRTYLPPGASLTAPANGLDNNTVVFRGWPWARKCS